MLGKERRMSRLFVGEKSRCLLSPLDHGGWLGPVKGLDRPLEIVRQVLAGGANAVLASPGFLRAAAPALRPDTGLVLRVSLTAGLSAQSTQETPIAQVETALRLDADAVAVSVFFGRAGDIEIYRWLAALIRACEPYEMPVVAEMMPPEDRFFDAAAIAHAARIGMEIGADVIKTNYCGDVARFAEIVQAAPVPIIVAGGPKTTPDASTLQLVADALQAGAAGVAIGRRVWQSDDPEATTRAIHEVMFR
ncbi:MAG TPA: fructose-bisphosphate aldolase [Chloroflexi bacterium]|nr:fructose-bisphosphate aldolase [Chloroflexota bacterium]